MTTIDSSDLANEKFLDSYIEGARQQFDAAQIERAAERLREKLPRIRVARRAPFGWLSLAAAASVLFAAITVMSVLLPGENGSAFAQAQQWFSSFRTLQIETTVEDESQNTVALINIWLDDSGDLRLETKGVVTIAKPEAGMIYMVLPDGQTVTQGIASNSVEDSTQWLAELRDFQGKADLLDESRYIEGVFTFGYKLTIGASNFVLWVDPVDNKPVLVEMEMPGGATMRSALSFDAPLPTDAFDVPDDREPF